MPCFNKLLGHSGFRRTATALPRAARLAYFPSSASYKTQALGSSTSVAATSVSCLATPPAVQALSAPAPMGRVGMAAFSASAASATSEASGSSDVPSGSSDVPSGSSDVPSAVPPGQKDPDQKDPDQKGPGLNDLSLDAATLEALTRMVAEKSAQANPGQDPGQKGPRQKDPGLKDVSPEGLLSSFFSKLYDHRPAFAFLFLIAVGAIATNHLSTNQTKSEAKLVKRMDSLEQKMEATRTELRTEMKELKAELRTEMMELKAEFKADLKKINSKMDKVMLVLLGVKTLKKPASEAASFVTPTSAVKVE